MTSLMQAFEICPHTYMPHLAHHVTGIIIIIVSLALNIFVLFGQVFHSHRHTHSFGRFQVWVPCVAQLNIFILPVWKKI